MLSEYFKLKTQTKEFNDSVNDLLAKLKDKLVLICGDYEQFYELNKRYNFAESFSFNTVMNTGKKLSKITGNDYKITTLDQIDNEKYDLILICDEYPEKIHEMISKKLQKTVQTEYLFNQLIDEYENTKFI